MTTFLPRNVDFFFRRSVVYEVFTRPFAALVLSLVCLPCMAQQGSGQPVSPSTPTAPSTAPQSTSDPAKPVEGTTVPDKNAGTSKDRLFYTLPNFLTLENGANLPPLTSKEKFKVVARGSFDPVIYPRTVSCRPSAVHRTANRATDKAGRLREALRRGLR